MFSVMKAQIFRDEYRSSLCHYLVTTNVIPIRLVIMLYFYITISSEEHQKIIVSLHLLFIICIWKKKLLIARPSPSYSITFLYSLVPQTGAYPS